MIDIDFIEFYIKKVKSLEIVDIKKIKAINNPNSFLYNFLAGAKSGLGSPFILTKKPTKSQALESIQAANKQEARCIKH